MNQRKSLASPKLQRYFLSFQWSIRTLGLSGPETKINHPLQPKAQNRTKDGRNVQGCFLCNQSSVPYHHHNPPTTTTHLLLFCSCEISKHLISQKHTTEPEETQAAGARRRNTKETLREKGRQEKSAMQCVSGALGHVDCTLIALVFGMLQVSHFLCTAANINPAVHQTAGSIQLLILLFRPPVNHCQSFIAKSLFFRSVTSH